MVSGNESLYDNILSKSGSEDEDSISDIKINLITVFPPPSVMKAYNDAFDNGAYRVFIEIQKILDHKIAMDREVVAKKLRQRRSGQIYGFTIALCFLVASFILILLGLGIYGTILGSVNIIALVTIFVLDKDFKNISVNEKGNHV
jgi:uncharacterized membrane protein